ncbi:MAG: class I SAM-dependent methyltransferase [Planctomycetes bacterium]|nr:class I SAM-dependent methyltransferase [Planctomycetota bacterium]
MTITQPASDARARADLLSRLYAEHAGTGAPDDYGYMRSHGQPGAIVHHVNVFEWYAGHIGPRATVLDWGCNHMPDSCMLRHKFGDELDLHACDFIPEHSFETFRSYARPNYARLADPFRLPYPGATFDAVIGSGTLEHTAMDGESLKELHRVLKVDGLLVVTYLPYAYSWDERRRRRAGRDYHRRLYTRRGFERLLLTHGFVPERIELQGFVPHRLANHKRPLWWRLIRPALHTVVEALWKPGLRSLRSPLFAHSVICGLARKVDVM